MGEINYCFGGEGKRTLALANADVGSVDYMDLKH